MMQSPERMDPEREQSEIQAWVLNAFLDAMKTNLYVTDPETDRILFMNKTMKRAFGLEHPEGKLCWEVLQEGMEGRCPFCPVEKLLRDGEGGPGVSWEEQNTVTGRAYENYDSLMRWVDGRLVHFQQSVDVTDSKRLLRESVLDDLTGTYNRREGKHRLAESLLRCADEGEPITLCMFDVNGLREVNEAHGHGEGDLLLSTVARAVVGTLGPGDYLFRLSGDEFVLVAEHSGEKRVRGMMKEAARTLEQRARELRRPYEISFCHGIAEFSSDRAYTGEEALAEVDRKMYLRKRQLHIERAQQQAERQRAQRRWAGSEAFEYDEKLLYDALRQSTDDYIYLCNMKTGTFLYPPAMVEEFDLPGTVLQNAAAVWGAKVHPQDKQAFLEANQEIIDGRVDSHSVEYRALNRRGEWVWVRCRGRLERDENGVPTLFAGMITNLGKKDNLDHITGLFNKFEFEEEIRRLLADRPGNRLGIIMLDMDGFKHINDLYDREFGDEVIRITAQRIQSLLPAGASVYRMDGDEFGILIRDGDRQDMRRIYGAIHEAFSRQMEYRGNKYYCSLSAGGVVYPENGDNFLDLVKYANYSLEYAKQNGKNRMDFFSGLILSQRTRRLDLIELLRESVENDYEGFEVYYQPQVRADTGQVAGAEALCRWRCGKYGPVPPVEFIPLLEESGLILPLGRWVFAEAARTCARWHGRRADLSVSVNLSVLQLSDPGLPEFMRETLRETGCDPARMVVEITESCIASNQRLAEQFFEELQDLGVRIAMDDFGTGYSSLGILKNLPVDLVKIDRTFVKGVRNSRFDATFIQFIVELCHTVNIQVCLEGVETEEEYGTVRPMRLDFIQGFLFDRPLPVWEFERNYLPTRAPGD